MRAVVPRLADKKQIFAERFELIEFLDGGGFAEVFRARDMWLEHDVALKVLRDTDYAERFVREVLAFRKLPKDRFVSVFDYVRAPHKCAETHAYSMELLAAPWQTLEQFVDESMSSLDEGERLRLARFIVLDLLEALSILHAEKIVHRDIKPDNLWIDGRLARRIAKGTEPSGSKQLLKIGDLGIAKNLKGKNAYTEGIGQVFWRAPEQDMVRSKVTVRTDVHAAGLVAMYVLCGVELAHDKRGKKVFIKNELASYFGSRHLGLRLASFIAQATQPNPNGRFASARKAATAFEKALDEDLLECFPALCGLPAGGLKKDEIVDLLFPSFARRHGWAKNRTVSRLDIVREHVEKLYSDRVLERSGHRYRLS